MSSPATPGDLLDLIASGSQVEVRDEEWLVRSTQQTPSDGLRVNCTGRSPFVRDTEATFFTNLDVITPLRPEDTKLVTDDSPGFRRSRLYLEAVIRKTPIPSSETALAVSQHQLLDELQFQRRAVHKSLENLRPRMLIADAVGLGKTLEVGMILSELIRRGRGEKILVVTPRHILEQFQHELWTRFAIPLVRLDSEGIQRVRRKIPGNRNPFTYYKRAIISIDTLKNVGRYRHHLEGIHWDAVVIDECHNLVNRGTLNNQLARVLSPNTEALLLTSATPHNGDPDSFAELVRLLDPTAIVDPRHIDQKEIEHLYVRRHKAHDEVAPEIGSKWADRLEPRPVVVHPSPEEEELFAELSDTWVHPASGKAPVTGQGRSLFPWTLFKAALSSHRALLQTVENRRKTLARTAGDTALAPDQRKEDDALERLAELCEAIDDDSASKLDSLVTELKAIGVGPRSDTRVVVFSERIATLDWLAEAVPRALKLKPKSVRVLHGGLADVKQMDVIEEFSLTSSPVRLLFTGDMASEGVNLHRQCNHLIHFDLPWSLITIEQRNGRIDRYGQTRSPDIRALVVTPAHPRLSGDVRIVTKLLEREYHAHKAFGESASLLGLHASALEEEEITKALRDGRDPDEVVPQEPVKPFDLMTIIAGATGTDPVPTTEPPTLFSALPRFVDETLRFAYEDPESLLGIRREPDDPTLVSIEAPTDLVRRLQALPQSYLTEQRVVDRLRLTADDHIANQQLARAREDTSSTWPEVGYLSPLHPFVDWLADKVLVAVERNQAPVIMADVASPIFCIQGIYSNGRGQPQLVEWLAVRPGASEPVGELFQALKEAGVRHDMANPGASVDTAALAKQLPTVIEAARTELERRRNDREVLIERRLEEHRLRRQRWTQGRMDLEERIDNQAKANALRKDRERIEGETDRLIESMRTTGRPLIRVLAVLVGAKS